ncbi:hypothetical protein PM082_024420 [Marasmius tenuissimus]|nr:hypothetical protein PM082_024420 [Marasmius tenuissimus]
MGKPIGVIVGTVRVTVTPFDLGRLIFFKTPEPSVLYPELKKACRKMLAEQISVSSGSCTGDALIIVMRNCNCRDCKLFQPSSLQNLCLHSHCKRGRVDSRVKTTIFRGSEKERKQEDIEVASRSRVKALEEALHSSGVIAVISHEISPKYGSRTLLDECLRFNRVQSLRINRINVSIIYSQTHRVWCTTYKIPPIREKPFPAAWKLLFGSLASITIQLLVLLFLTPPLRSVLCTTLSNFYLSLGRGRCGISRNANVISRAEVISLTVVECRSSSWTSANCNVVTIWFSTDFRYATRTMTNVGAIPYVVIMSEFGCFIGLAEKVSYKHKSHDARRIKGYNPNKRRRKPTQGRTDQASCHVRLMSYPPNSASYMRRLSILLHCSQLERKDIPVINAKTYWKTAIATTAPWSIQKASLARERFVASPAPRAMMHARSKPQLHYGIRKIKYEYRQTRFHCPSFKK